MTSERIAYTTLAPTAIESFGVSNEQLTIEEPTDYAEDDSYAIGQYEYESEPLFGSPTACDGMYVYHYQSRLFGIVAPGGSFEMVRGPFTQLQELCAVDGVPDITPEQTHALYRDLGTGPYKVRFTDTLWAYDRDTRRGVEYNPELAAEQNAQDSTEVIVSPEYVQGLVDSAISDEKYVSSARLKLNGESITYEAPLCIHATDTTVADLVEITSLVNDYFIE